MLSEIMYIHKNRCASENRGEKLSALKQPSHIHVFTKKGMKENANAKLPFWITVLNCFEQLCWNFTKASFHFDTFCQNTLHY